MDVRGLRKREEPLQEVSERVVSLLVQLLLLFPLLLYPLLVLVFLLPYEPQDDLQVQWVRIPLELLKVVTQRLRRHPRRQEQQKPCEELVAPVPIPLYCPTRGVERRTINEMFERT